MENRGRHGVKPDNTPITPAPLSDAGTRNKVYARRARGASDIGGKTKFELGSPGQPVPRYLQQPLCDYDYQNAVVHQVILTKRTITSN